jgi:hypothetical protein
MRKTVLDLFFQLSLNVNWKKSNLIPSQHKEWLGIEINTEREQVTFYIPFKKLHEITHECICMVHKMELGLIPVCHVARVTGLCVSEIRTVVLK